MSVLLFPVPLSVGVLCSPDALKRTRRRLWRCPPARRTLRVNARAISATECRAHLTCRRHKLSCTRPPLFLPSLLSPFLSPSLPSFSTWESSALKRPSSHQVPILAPSAHTNIFLRMHARNMRRQGACASDLFTAPPALPSSFASLARAPYPLSLTSSLRYLRSRVTSGYETYPASALGFGAAPPVLHSPLPQDLRAHARHRI
ncbi:hypothetical protein C8R45DRAFT_356756 [Mycena sanguinolenta]|nr:hypothetical protein C8R45DRAFT_356756 [Mycena sanguinolenta]